jgi:hypothetical protein
VLQQLRREVGFGCPVPDCGSPYLEWHHFDPEWRERKHHNPEGMIALCREHHAKAGSGAFTKDQLRRFKQLQHNVVDRPTGRFDWMRQALLTVVGGNFFYEVDTILEFRGEKAIWFNRDEEGHPLLNVRMITKSGQQRMRIEDNFWITRGDPIDIESPPSGRKLRSRYVNGDEISLEFLEIPTALELNKRYPEMERDNKTWPFPFPLTAVEIGMKIGDSPHGFSPKAFHLPGFFMSRCVMTYGGVAVALDL